MSRHLSLVHDQQGIMKEVVKQAQGHEFAYQTGVNNRG